MGFATFTKARAETRWSEVLTRAFGFTFAKALEFSFTFAFLTTFLSPIGFFSFRLFLTGFKALALIGLSKTLETSPAFGTFTFAFAFAFSASAYFSASHFPHFKTFITIIKNVESVKTFLIFVFLEETFKTSLLVFYPVAFPLTI